MNIELRHLRWFVVLAEQLHFRRAAERLHVSQPPLSNAIKALENTLGVPLFHRDRRSVALTEAGALMLARAQAVLAAYEQFVETGQGIANGTVGVLRLGMTISAPFIAEVSSAIVQMQAQYPQIRVESSHIVTAMEAIAALQNGHTDVCILRPYKNQQFPPSIRHVRLKEDRLMLLLHRSHPLCALERVPLARLAAEQLVTYAPPAPALALQEAIGALFARCATFPSRIQEVREMSAVFGLVSMNVGFAILPSSLNKLATENVVWREIDADASLLAGMTVLAYTEARVADGAVGTFVRLVTERPLL